MKNEDLRPFYDAVFARGERKHFTSFLTRGTPTAEVAEVLRTARPLVNRRVLEVGCGTGDFARAAAAKKADVTAIDFSAEAIAQASRHRPRSMSKYPVRFECRDVFSVTGRYDVIVLVGTLEHMDDPMRVLAHLKKCLAPGGRLIITCPNWSNARGHVLLTLAHLLGARITLADLHYLTPSDFIKWARALRMRLTWRTFDRSWGHGETMVKDLRRRLPKVLAEVGIEPPHDGIARLLAWFEENNRVLRSDLPHSGALALYTLSR